MTEADNPSAPRILVDADACPVKEEALRVAARYGLPVVIVSNGGLRPSRDPLVRHVVVPRTPDAADDWIVENATPADIVVTADILLAARCVELGVQVIGPDGRPFTEDSIGMAVAMRNLKQHLRETGDIQGHNPGFTKADRSRFLGEMDRLARRAKGGG
ncbi:YaiI/YqxD family protein [Bauldia litoralis]|uniref:YaiI/YqxD family protein n=1 Tax=Bauldia litoralis TaxID=665467 RepID=UPI003266748E